MRLLLTLFVGVLFSASVLATGGVFHTPEGEITYDFSASPGVETLLIDFGDDSEEKKVVCPSEECEFNEQAGSWDVEVMHNYLEHAGSELDLESYKITARAHYEDGDERTFTRNISVCFQDKGCGVLREESVTSAEGDPAATRVRKAFLKAKKAFHEARQEIQAIKKGDENPAKDVPTFFESEEGNESSSSSESEEGNAYVIAINVFFKTLMNG